MPLTGKGVPEFGFRGFYDDPIWLREAFKYEKTMAIALGNSEPVLKAARETLRKLRNVLFVYYSAHADKNTSDAALAEAVAGAFFTSDTSSEGQVGKSADGGNAARLQRMIDGTGDANLRALMTAIYNAAYYRTQQRVEMQAKNLTAAEIAEKLGLHSEVGFNSVLRASYLDGSASTDALAHLDLNTASLSEYARYLEDDVLARLVDAGWGKLDLPEQAHFARDFYAVGNMAARTGDGSYLQELSVGATKGLLDNDNLLPEYIMGHLSPADYVRVGNPLSSEERSLLEDDQTTVQRTVWDFDVLDGEPAMLADGTPDLDALRIQDRRQRRAAPARIQQLEAEQAKGPLTPTKADELKQARAVLLKGAAHSVVRDGGKWVVLRERAKTVTWSELRKGDLADFVHNLDRDKVANLVATGMSRTAAEERAKADLARVQGPEYPVQWRTGLDNYEPLTRTSWTRQTAIGRGLPVKVVISGTTARMMATFCWLNVQGIPARHFMYAILAWMLPEHDHTLYEILRGAGLALDSLKHPRQDRAYFDALGQDLESIDAVPLYTRFHTMLTEGPWAERNVRGLPDPVEPLCAVYRFKANDPAGDPFLDIRLNDIRQQRPGEYEEAVTLKHDLPQLPLTAEQLAAIRYCTGPGDLLIDLLGGDGQADRINTGLPAMLAEHIESHKLSPNDARPEIPWILAGNRMFGVFNDRLRECQLKIRAARDPADVQRESAEIDRIGAEFTISLAKLAPDRLVREVRLHVAMACTGLEALPPLTGTAWQVKEKSSSQHHTWPAGSESVNPTVIRATSTKRVALTQIAATRTGTAPVLVRTELTGSGRDVEAISKQPDDHHVLLLPNTKFRVTSAATPVRDHTELTIAEVEETADAGLVILDDHFGDHASDTDSEGEDDFEIV